MNRTKKTPSKPEPPGASSPPSVCRKWHVNRAVRLQYPALIPVLRDTRPIRYTAYGALCCLTEDCPVPSEDHMATL
jgi:hypothetical protein